LVLLETIRQALGRAFLLDKTISDALLLSFVGDHSRRFRYLVEDCSSLLLVRDVL